ncbi:ATP-binding protein [Kitasatospora sp. NPDC048365]|uniref:ATP-binding protein n=1 Tax=Kitasatospora sp. NPDC048365 TaxID=3364050 RepID=UPI003719F103
MADTARGRLRIFLGAAPGVGKTYAMLSEAHRRRSRGADVVVGFVEHHDRALTAGLLDGLEAVPRKAMRHRGAEFTEMDLDAVLARRPAVALVDELAHTNVPGSRNAKRWQDVAELLAAGIDVVSTVNIQHLESLGDVVEGITGIRQRETVPDEVVRRAEQVELVDMDPQALRRRLAHGNVYAPDKVDAALAHYFRPGNLTALRELALLWTADRVDEYLQRYRAEQGIKGTWQARERIVVGLTGGPEGATLVRRAARIAARASGGELLAVHIARSDGLAGSSSQALIEQRVLVESLGGSFHTVLGEEPAAGLLDFARGVNATQIVLGTSRRKVRHYLSGPGVGHTVIRDCGDIDVHMVTHEQAARGLGRIPIRKVTDLGRTRTVAGWLIGVAGPVLLALLLTHYRGVGLPTDMLLFLSLTVCAALVGGLFPAIGSALVGSATLNYFFAPPLHTFTIAEPENIAAVAIFCAVGIAVATVVDTAARRSQQAARSQAEAQTLSVLAGTVLRGAPDGEGMLAALLDQVRETFQEESVALLERRHEFDPWHPLAVSGPHPPEHPDDGQAAAPAGSTLALVLTGRVLPAADRRLLGAFAAQAAVLVEHRRLADEAAAARREAEGNRIRTALLAAVSHDLRTPLAGIKAAVTSLRAVDVEWDEEDEAELLAGIESGADRLDHLINNLLDMSRLQTGTVTPLIRPTDLDEVVPYALGGVAAGAVTVDVPESLPMVLADAGLLERSLGNLVENAVKYSPPGSPVLVKADLLRTPGGGVRVELRIVDRGPGVPEDARERIFAPFQRYGDAPRGAGVGLGLAVARGFAEAMDGTVTAEDTPGGGLTMVVSLPVAGLPDAAGPSDRADPADSAGPSDPAGPSDIDRERKADPV